MYWNRYLLINYGGNATWNSATGWSRGNKKHNIENRRYEIEDTFTDTDYHNVVKPFRHNDCICFLGFQKFEKKYQQEVENGNVTHESQFEYAWCLVRSNFSSDINKVVDESKVQKQLIKLISHANECLCNRISIGYTAFRGFSYQTHRG